MNWAHKKVGLGWIELVENVLWKWISTISKVGRMEEYTTKVKMCVYIYIYTHTHTPPLYREI